MNQFVRTQDIVDGLFFQSQRHYIHIYEWIYYLSLLLLAMSSLDTSHQHGVSEQTPNEFEKFNNGINIKMLPIYTRSQLSLYNGIDEPEVYVAIKGYIYDVSNNVSNYGPGRPYHKLVGKDVSRLLGLNQLQLKPTGDPYAPEKDNAWYTGDFTEKENLIVDKWELFFRKRYTIIGVVVDHEVGT